MCRFRRLDRTAVEIDEIGDLPLRSPYRRLHQSKAEGKSFRLIYRMARGVTFDLSLALWPRRPSSKVKKSSKWAGNNPPIANTPLEKGRRNFTDRASFKDHYSTRKRKSRATIRYIERLLWKLRSLPTLSTKSNTPILVTNMSQ